MIYIVPITGDATCGKTYFCEKVKEVYGDGAIYVDTSMFAKKFFEDLTTNEAFNTQKLTNAIFLKNREYRDALNLVIRALDMFDIRLKYTIKCIENAINHTMTDAIRDGKEIIEDLFIFVNVRELDFIKRIFYYCNTYDYRFKMILMHDKSTTGTSNLAIDDYDCILHELKCDSYFELYDHTILIEDSKSIIYDTECIETILNTIKNEKHYVKFQNNQDMRLHDMHLNEYISINKNENVGNK